MPRPGRCPGRPAAAAFAPWSRAVAGQAAAAPTGRHSAGAGAGKSGNGSRRWRAQRRQRGWCQDGRSAWPVRQRCAACKSTLGGMEPAPQLRVIILLCPRMP